MAGIMTQLTQLSESAGQQFQSVGDASASFGQGLKRTLENGSKEVSTFVSTLGDIFDVEDLVKSLRNVTTSEEQVSRKTSVIHEPIDWSKYPRSAFQKGHDEWKPFGKDVEVEGNEDSIDQKAEENIASSIEKKEDEKSELAQNQSRVRKVSLLPSVSQKSPGEKMERRRRHSTIERPVSRVREESEHKSFPVSLQSKLKSNIHADQKRKTSVGSFSPKSHVLDSARLQFESNLSSNQKHSPSVYRRNKHSDSKAWRTLQAKDHYDEEDSLEPNISLDQNVDTLRNPPMRNVELPGSDQEFGSVATDQNRKRRKSHAVNWN